MDLEDISEEVQSQMNFVFVDTIDDVLEIALLSNSEGININDQ